MATSSQIESVKIYHQGATVYRTLKVSAAEIERGELEVGQLPLSLADATVRVRVQSVKPAGQELLVRRISVGLAPKVAVDLVEGPSRETVQAKERAVTAKALERAQIRAELSAIEGLEVPERPEGEEGRPPPSSPMAARVALEAFRGGAIDKRTEELRALDDALEKLQEELTDLQRRVAEASNANRVKPGDLAKTIYADVEGEGVTEAELELAYFVPGARWTPAYQCHLTRDGSDTRLHMRALICQRTGEDWRGVKLQLSTASPMRWSELPDLSSIRIGRAQPTPPSVGFRPPPRGAAQLFADFDRKRSTSGGLVPPTPSWSGPRPGGVNAPAVGIAQRAPAPKKPKARASRRAKKMAPATEEAVFGGMNDSVDLAMPAMDMDMAMEMEDDFDESTPADGYADKSVVLEARSLAAPPMAAAAPAPSGARTRSGMAKERSAPGPSDDDLGTIYFHQLVLGDASDASRRGKLQPASLRDRYQASLSRAGVHLDADPLSVVAEAQNVARSALRTPMPGGGVDVRQVAGHFDFLYEGKTAIDVPSDGVFHSVPLVVEEAEAELKYVVVPREDTNVFRVATVKNPSEAPLLSGPAEVYVAGEYVLTTNIPTVGPAGDFRLGLGVEQAIKCARNTHYQEKRSGEKVVAMNELEHSIEIELANRLARDVECEVRERLPFPSQDAEVVVEETLVEPRWSEYDQRDRGTPIAGGRRWTVKIAAGETQTLKAEYVVRIYANNELVGGNRREA